MARLSPAEIAASLAARASMCAIEECAEPPHGGDRQAAGAANDARQAIILSRGERDLVLGEIRLMLEATEGVVAGLAAYDMRAIEQAAARAAPSAPGAVDQAMNGALPEEFRHMGAAALGGSGDVARLTREGARAEAVTMRLSQTLHQCTSCNGACRIEAED